MEFSTRRELEKHALQKYDKNAIEIIDSAPLAAVYVFDKKLVKWEKMSCEGILFLYKKMFGPYFNLFLLNRLSNSHLYQPINPNLKLQVENSYLLFKTDDSTIFGLWIHDKEIYDRISSKIKNIINNINLQSLCRISYESDQNNSIGRMLRRTEEEYLKSFYCLKRLRINKDENTNEPNSVAKFFQDAGKVFKNSKTALRFPLFPDEPTDSLIRKKIIGNPKYNVKCIENNQRCCVMNDICSD